MKIYDLFVLFPQKLFVYISDLPSLYSTLTYNPPKHPSLEAVVDCKPIYILNLEIRTYISIFWLNL